MIDAGILDGDYIVVKKCSEALNGEIVVAMIDDSATVKRFFKRDRRIILQPENEEYSPIELSPVDFETGEARILGVAQEVKIKL